MRKKKTSASRQALDLDKVLQLSLGWLFSVLVLVTPFVFTWFNEELFEFNKMIFVYGLTILITAGWLARMIIQQKAIWHRTPLDIPILLFLLTQLLSTLASIHPRTSWFGYYTRFHGGLLSSISYSLLYWAFVSNLSRRQVKGLLISTLVASVGVSVYAIPEHFGHSPSCLLITDSFDVACWVQDVKSRVFGTFGQPNWLAAYAITLIPLASSLMLSERITATTAETRTSKLLRQALYLGSGLLLVITLLYTRSRSGLAGLGVGTLMILVGKIWWLWRQSRRELIAQVLGIGLLFVLLIAALGTPFTPSIFNSLFPTPSPTPTPEASSTPVVNRLDVGGTDSGEIRQIVWEGAYKIWRRYPWLGSGVETFAYSYYLDRPEEHNNVSEWDFLYNKAHNEFLNYLATTGILGLIAYVILLSSLLLYPAVIFYRSSTEEKKTSQEAGLVALGVSSGLVSLSISNALGFSTVMVTVLMYLLPGSIVILAKKQSSDSSHPAPTFPVTALSQTQKLSLGILSLIAVFLGWQVWSMWRADNLFAVGKHYFQSGYPQEGLMMLQTAASLMPNEALYYDELADSYAKLAVAYSQAEPATQAAALNQALQFSDAAIEASNLTLKLNPAHLNFYKTRARIFLSLEGVNPEYLQEAKKTLQTALKLAPTDAKLWYNLGLVEISLGNRDEAIAILEKTVAMKPNYDAARNALAGEYEKKEQFINALEQYRYIIKHITPDNEIVKMKIQVLEASQSSLKP